MNKYVLSVLGAGFCWGFMGFFTRNLAQFGIDSSGAVLARCSVAAICFGISIVLKNPKSLKIKLKDFWCFLGSGILALLFFTFCYFQAISITSLSTAAILLYTAPTIVMVLSAILFKEKITRNKLIALVLAFVGCALVSGIANGSGLGISTKGLLYGLGSGLGYALFSIFARFAMNRGYTGLVINFYSCILASIGAAAIWGVKGLWVPMTASLPGFFWVIAAGVFSCFIPYLIYTYGLSGMETGKASVLASLEPVVASIIGVVIYHETMSISSFIGIVLVLSAVVLLNVNTKKKTN
ncbi:MAG: DMT family transporter [Clostridia bacterium]|nr:DMT family transporter [Clostridia bacterium]